MTSDKTLFEHTDDDGDSVCLDLYGDHLILVARDSDSGQEARVRLFGPGHVSSTERVQRLYDVLGCWLDSRSAEDETKEASAPAPALHVDTAVTADDVRRIAADEAVKLLITGVVLERFKALAQEEVQRHQAERRNQMREIAEKVSRDHWNARQGFIRAVAQNAVRDVFTRIAETGV